MDVQLSTQPLAEVEVDWLIVGVPESATDSTSLLYGVESIRTGQALDSGNLSAVDFNGKHQAGINDSVIQGNSARTTIAVVTSFLGTGHA